MDATQDFRACASCDELKPISEYYLSRWKDRTYPASACKDCTKKRIRDRRRNRPGFRPKGLRASGAAGMTVRERIQFYAEFKARRGCADCGTRENLEFDHLPEHVKYFTIGEALQSTTKYSDDDIAREVAKCEVVCHACHQRRTQSRRRNGIVVESWEATR